MAGTSKPYFPYFLARNSAGDSQLFWQEDNISPKAAQPQYCYAEGRPGGRSVWDWDLKYGTRTEWAFVKPVPWLWLYPWSDTKHILESHPSSMSPRQPTHLWHEFPSITLSEAMSLHYYFLLFFSLLHRSPSDRQFWSQVFWVGSYNSPFILSWELCSIHWCVYIFKYFSYFHYCFLMKSCKTSFLKT